MECGAANTRDNTPPAIDFDVRAQATKHLSAIELDLNATSAAAMLAMRRLTGAELAGKCNQGGVWRPMPEQVAALAETERLDILWNLIANSFYSGEILPTRTTSLAPAPSGSGSRSMRTMR